MRAFTFELWFDAIWRVREREKNLKLRLHFEVVMTATWQCDCGESLAEVEFTAWRTWRWSGWLFTCDWLGVWHRSSPRAPCERKVQIDDPVILNQHRIILSSSYYRLVLLRSSGAELLAQAENTGSSQGLESRQYLSRPSEA